MKYWYIYQVNSVWYVWDLNRDDISSLKIKDAILHSFSIKAILLGLEELPNDNWVNRGLVINTEFSPYDGKVISIGGRHE